MMLISKTGQRGSKKTIQLLMILVGALLISFFAWQTIAQAEPEGPSAITVVNGDIDFEASYTLLSGQGFGQSIEVSQTQQINFSLRVVGGADLTLTFFDPGLNTLWSETVSPGETIWGTTTLLTGTNSISYANGGGGNNQFTIKINSVPNPPASFAGVADSAGINSAAAIGFTQAGFYTFTLDVNAGRTYTVELDNLLTEVVTETMTVVNYIPVSTPTMTITQPSGATGTLTTWSVDIALQSDSALLPYTQNETISVPTSKVLPLTVDTAVNLQLSATGGTSIDMGIVDEGGDLITTTQMTVAAGESIWATADLPTGVNTIFLTPTGSVNYDLIIDSIPDTDQTFDGNSAAAGQTSTARLNVPTGGLYSFDFAANSGSYQFELASSGGQTMFQRSIDGSDQSTVYIPSGLHTLLFDHSTTSGADWGITVTLQQASNTQLPFVGLSGDLGGGADAGSVEIWPVRVGSNLSANLNMTVTGGTSDSFEVALLDSSGTEQQILSPIYGTELYWGSLNLSSGMNYLRISADGGNGAPVSYQFSLESAPALPGSDITWSGESVTAGMPHTYTVDLLLSGLYRFDLTPTAGRFQLYQPTDNLRTTVEGGKVITAYFTAGQYQFVTIPDDTVATDWSITLASTALSQDELPWRYDGGSIGGPGNRFDEEWHPIHVGESGWANVLITPTAASSDFATFGVWASGAGSARATTPVYGNEAEWLAVELPADGKLEVAADSGNGGGYEYEAAVLAPAVAGFDKTLSWAGSDSSSGTPSSFVVHLPYTGTYNFTTTLNSGTATVTAGSVEDSAATATVTQPSDQISLGSGYYLITVTQTAPLAAWDIDLSIDEILSPTLTSVNPISLTAGVTNTTAVEGSNFYSPTFTLVGSSGTFPATVDSFDATGANITLNNAIPAGTYDLTITNQDGKTGTLVDAIVIIGPEISSIIPNSVRVGYQTGVTIFGTNIYQPNAYLSLSGTDYPLTVNSASATEIDATVPNTLPVGIYDLFIVNGSLSADQSNTLTETFEVLPPIVPIVSAVSPASMTFNQSDFLIISGSDFLTPTAYLSDGTLTTTLSIFESTGDTITTVVPIGLAVGFYDIYVENGTPTNDRSNILTDGFEITLDIIPNVSAVSPSNVTLGGDMSITVTGSSFVTPTLYLSNNVRQGADYPVEAEQFSPTSIQATLPSTLPVGTYDLYVTNANGRSSNRLSNILTISVGEYDLYIPLAGVNFVPFPDLVIDEFSATADSLTLVISNQGGKSITDEFWVDLYINPATPPTGPNETIETLDSQGLVWLIPAEALPIPSGGTLSLQIDGPYYQTDKSDFGGTFPAGATLYVQVDSADVATSYGGVHEVHEAFGTTYNNIAQTNVVTR